MVELVRVMSLLQFGYVVVREVAKRSGELFWVESVVSRKNKIRLWR
jgi:hypothetical protein